MSPKKPNNAVMPQSSIVLTASQQSNSVVTFLSSVVFKKMPSNAVIRDSRISNPASGIQPDIAIRRGIKSLQDMWYTADEGLQIRISRIDSQCLKLGKSVGLLE